MKLTVGAQPALMAAVLCGGCLTGPVLAQSSLYERLGGEKAIRAVVDDFTGRVLKDDSLRRWFAHVADIPANVPEYKGAMAAFMCQATGGPCRYGGPDMKTVHAGKHITSEAFATVMHHMKITLDHLKVRETEERELLGMLEAMKPLVVEKQ